MRQAGRYLPEYRATRAKAGGFLDLCYTPELAIEVSLQPYRRFATDAVILFSDILVVADALGRKVSFVEGEGPRLDPLEDVASIPRFEPDRFHAHLEPVYEAVRGLAKTLADGPALIGFAGAPWTVACYMVDGGGSRDFGRTKGWAFEDPEGFAQLIERLIEATAEYLIAQARAGAEALQLFDSWAGLLPPDDFARWCIAPAKEIVRRVKDVVPGVLMIGFPRGAGLSYERYGAEAGVDGIAIDPTVPCPWAAAALQPHAALQGNLDPYRLLVGGAGMEDAACSILETLGGGPFIFNLGHGILPATPLENVERLVALVRGQP